MANREYEFKEELFYYPPAEREPWLHGDESAVRSLLDRCGPLGRTPETYVNQLHSHPGQNYPELRYAVHLVEEQGYPRTSIFYENYRLSAAWQKIHGPSSMMGKNTSALRAVFTGTFFDEYDRLSQLNADSRVTGDKLANAHVDLCAVDATGRRVKFVEVKTYRSDARGNPGIEQIAQHQLRLLAIVRHLSETLGHAVLQGPVEVSADIVAFVPESMRRSVRPTVHKVCIRA